ncbi:MAG: MerR family transcriptional regulator [Actinobacteria bacterium]|nr:MerR family transcriptional regulator [Actinomycetota bacterium]
MAARGVDLFSIGEFSRVSKISVKALRHYDERGLLKPGHVDARSGYRYYSSAQLAEANLIRLLRSLQLPLEDIRLFLRERDPGRRRALLEGHRKNMEEQLSRYRSILSSIERIIAGGGEGMRREVGLRELAGQNILSVRLRTDYDRLGGSIVKAFGDIHAILGERGEHPSGPPFSIYYGEEWDEKDIDLETCVPVARPMGGRGRVQGKELPGCLVAFTMHNGPYHELAEAYQALDLWIRKEGYAYAGASREVYLVGFDQVRDEADLRTEVMFPVRKA